MRFGKAAAIQAGSGVLMSANAIARMVLPGWLVVAILLTAVAAQRLEQGPAVPSLPPDAARGEIVYLPEARHLRPFGLGYDNVLADILWFRTISYFGKHYRSDRAYPWLEAMCRVVTDLDPRAEYVYRFCGMILPWEAGDAAAGMAILRKGARNLPQSWLLRYWLGFYEYFFRDDLDAATEHLRRAAEIPGAPPQVAALLAVLLKERYGPRSAVRFLEEMASGTTDPRLRDILDRQKRRAILAEHLDELQKAVAEYRRRFGRFPSKVEDVVSAGILSAVPREPFGGQYAIDPVSGAVTTTSGMKPLRVHESKTRKEILGESSSEGS